MGVRFEWENRKIQVAASAASAASLQPIILKLSYAASALYRTIVLSDIFRVRGKSDAASTADSAECS